MGEEGEGRDWGPEKVRETTVECEAHTCYRHCHSRILKAMPGAQSAPVQQALGEEVRGPFAPGLDRPVIHACMRRHITQRSKSKQSLSPQRLLKPIVSCDLRRSTGSKSHVSHGFCTALNGESLPSRRRQKGQDWVGERQICLFQIWYEIISYLWSNLLPVSPWDNGPLSSLPCSWNMKGRSKK